MLYNHGPRPLPVTRNACSYGLYQCTTGACTSQCRRRCSTGAVASAAAADEPPYKFLSVPVYSLSTNGAGALRQGSTGRPTMNIVTYASPVALKPPLYAVGLYKGTQSWENWRSSRSGLLQILRRQHAELLPLLGKTSARDVDKLARLGASGVKTVERLGYASLADCAGVMEIQQIGELLDAGDHEVALCSVGQTLNVDAEGEVLYTDFLRQQGHI